jgi:hypothetical protein
MNLNHLGDALDHWKGSLLEQLTKAGALNDLRADPMLSDPDDWKPPDWPIFATMLRLEPRYILRHKHHLRDDRQDYFREITHSADLFLDPDTGIDTSQGKKPDQYIRPKELEGLLDVDPTRVLAVYQHIGRMKTRERLETIARVVRTEAGPLYCCSYESPTVAMVFFSRSHDRIQAIHGSHAALLGRHGAKRPMLWPCG